MNISDETVSLTDSSQNGPESRDRVVILGAGIVGSALAKYLSDISDSPIIVIDSSLDNPKGSTAYAPGLVGQLNEIPTLTTLAKESVAEYKKLPNGFDAVGGLEIASTPAGIENLHKRYKLAKDAGLPADIITSADAARLVPHLHSADTVSQALHFPGDGTANAANIVAAYQELAKSNGVTFLQDTLQSIDQVDGHVTSVTTSSKNLKTNRVVVTTGIWTTSILSKLNIHLPIIPVAHPYVHSAPRPLRSKQSTPFVRWPERHVYARDHGTFDGFGSYDHAPVATKSLTSSVIGAWDPRFDDAIGRALDSTFPTLMDRETMKPFNGLFAVTPDGLPLAGPISGIEGLWVVAAVWVTHAAGMAKVVADMMVGGGEEVDGKVRGDVDPNRFRGRDEGELERAALGTYNDIYNLSFREQDRDETRGAEGP